MERDTHRIVLHRAIQRVEECRVELLLRLPLFSRLRSQRVDGKGVGETECAHGAKHIVVGNAGGRCCGRTGRVRQICVEQIFRIAFRTQPRLDLIGRQAAGAQLRLQLGDEIRTRLEKLLCLLRRGSRLRCERVRETRDKRDDDGRALESKHHALPRLQRFIIYTSPADSFTF
jgi:hypothetical protein